MKIVMSQGRHWVVEFETMEYPAREYPVYFASPIYQNEKWELEMRRAGADFLSSEKCIDSNLSQEEIQQIKNSIKDFLSFCERVMKEFYKDSNEYKRFYPMILENLEP